MASRDNSRLPSTRKNTNSKSKKGKASKRNPRGFRINKEYHNLLLVFLGLFLIYGLVSNSDAIIPKFIQYLLKGSFGGLAIIIPINIIFIGIINSVDGNEKLEKFKDLKGQYIVFLYMIVYYGLINYGRSPAESPFKMYVLQDIMKMGVTREGIGLIPSIITYYLTNIFGLVGAWLIILFLTMISIMLVFKIKVSDITSFFGSKVNVTDLKSIFKNSKEESFDTAAFDIEEENKVGFLNKFKNLFTKNKNKFNEEYYDEYYEDDLDEDKTIKIVGFNKAEDDYLEIIEGTQSLSDLEILQQMQNEEPVIDGLVSKVDLEYNSVKNNNKKPRLLQLDDETDFVDSDEINRRLEEKEHKSSSITKNSNEQNKGAILKSESNGTYNLNPMSSVANFEEVNEHIKFANYKIPPITLLNKVVNKNDKKSKQKVLENARQLEQTLRDFGVDAVINQVTVGPSITRYEIQPKPGVKVSKIVNLTDDIALSLAAKSIRMEAPIPGKSAIGIEVPNDESQMVSVREIIESREFNDFKSPLAMGLGKDVSGKIIIGDIAKMPHLLIAGSTGSGKSVCVNTLITSIIYKAKPDEVKLMLIDPKVVELANYNGIPHLLVPVVTDPRKAANALNWAVSEMNRRYNLFAESQVKDITSYNEKTDNPLPKIVIIIDELADLMMVSSNEVEDCICRLAQMARAAGMHLIVATQRPSVDVITGVIKANIPSRISFAVSSQTDSRTIIDMGGAEKLLGKGDMLFYPLGASKPVRLQGAFISEEESEKVIEHIKKEVGEMNYVSEIEESISNVNTAKYDGADELLYDAIEFIVSSGQASSSMLQRKYKIGFNRAARIIDDLEERGIVGPSEGSKPRKVLISKEDLEDLSRD